MILGGYGYTAILSEIFSCSKNGLFCFQLCNSFDSEHEIVESYCMGLMGGHDREITQDVDLIYKNTM